MNLQIRKYLFLIIWLLIICVGPVTILKNTPFDSVAKDPVLLLNFFQRISGLLLFTLLFIQIMLGSLMSKWVQILGAKAFWFHLFEGLTIYVLLLFHPLMEVSIVYKLTGSFINAIAVFVPSLKDQREIYLTYARTSFVLLNLTIAAAYFRTSPFLRKHWQKLHFLNYFIFYLIYLHMRIGTDIMTPPFLYLSWIALVGVSVSLLIRVKNIFTDFLTTNK